MRKVRIRKEKSIEGIDLFFIEIQMPKYSNTYFTYNQIAFTSLESTEQHIKEMSKRGSNPWNKEMLVGYIGSKLLGENIKEISYND